ncbi:MAG: T9SS type A sorting domain-containing protein [Paludibacter sp.]|nr:T9SS type A sorting domain-containing protein [Paludibacter sp.]
MKKTFYSNSITPEYMTRYYYDALNRDTTELYFNHNFETNSLTEYKKMKYSYDANNDVIKTESFNISNSIWSPSDYSDYIFNNTHDCISFIENDFNAGVYESSMKYITRYTESILMSNIYYGDTFADFPYPFKTQLNQIDLYALSGSESVLMGGYVLYYSENKETTGVYNTSELNNQIVKYNAELKTIVLQNAELGNSNIIQLYSLSGKMIINKPISTSGSVSVDNLGKGLYVYKLINSGKTVVGKIIIQ